MLFIFYLIYFIHKILGFLFIRMLDDSFLRLLLYLLFLLIWIFADSNSGCSYNMVMQFISNLRYNNDNTSFFALNDLQFFKILTKAYSTYYKYINNIPVQIKLYENWDQISHLKDL